MIEARTARDGEVCTSHVRKHRMRLAPPPAAILGFTIGGATGTLCEECARDAFNALGFLITSVTGESVAQLVGLKKRKAKR